MRTSSNSSLNECFNAAQFLVETLKDGQELPYLDSGLCWLLSEEDAHCSMYDGFEWLFYYSGFISTPSKWTEERMNLLALIAVMDASDFE